MPDNTSRPPDDEAGRAVWMAARNAEYQKRIISGFESEARERQAAQEPAPEKPKASWLERAAALKDEMKGAFSTAVEGAQNLVKDIPKIEPGHGPTTVDVYRRQHPGADM